MQRIVRTLDRWEAEFLKAVRKLLAARVRALEPVVEAVLSPGGGGQSVLRRLSSLAALPGDYLPLLERYVGHLLVEGMTQGREDVEFLRRRRGVRLRATLDGEPVVPQEALDFLRRRRDLGRFFERDQVDIVRSILDKALSEGATVQQTMDALQAALPDSIGRARAENIARTEATMAYNQGRLTSFRDSDGFVAAVEFMAVTDARTTDICRARDGLVFALDDPLMPVPPLHFMCRSILSPVSLFELEDLGGADYLDKMRARAEKAPPPIQGFGDERGLPEEPDAGPPMPRPEPVRPSTGGEAKALPRPEPVQVPATPGPAVAPAPRPSPIVAPAVPALPALTGSPRLVAEAVAVRNALVEGFAQAHPAAWEQVRLLPAAQAILAQSSAEWWLAQRGLSLQAIIARVAVAQAVGV